MLCGILFRLRDLDVRADDPQADGTTCSADQQQVTSTDVVNQVQQPDEGDDRLDYAEDTGGEHTGVGTADANALSKWSAQMHSPRLGWKTYLEHGR